MTEYLWSKTAATNATADSTINWAEGQAPSTVNDSARSMMAAIAKWRDDHAGSLLTTGTSTAYTLSTNQVFDTLAHMDGASLVVNFHTACGAAATLAVDGLAAKSIQVIAGTALSANQISAGIYTVYYDNSNSRFIVYGVGNAMLSAPSGTAMLFQQTTAPTLWTKSTTHDDKALRIVSGTPSSGGSTAFSTTFAAARSLGSVTVGETNLPAVVKSVTLAGTAKVNFSTATTQAGSGGTFNYVDVVGSGVGVADSQGLQIAASGTTAALGSGTVLSLGTLALAVNYVDFIIATKD